MVDLRKPLVYFVTPVPEIIDFSLSILLFSLGSLLVACHLSQSQTPPGLTPSFHNCIALVILCSADVPPLTVDASLL